MLQSSEGLASEPNPTEWVEQVLAWTLAPRRARAQRHQAIADECRQLADELLRQSRIELHDASGTPTTHADYRALRAGYPDAWAWRSALFHRATWHDRRARGQLYAEERVEQCRRGDSFVMACPGCGSVDDRTEERPYRCTSWRYCVSCRGARCAEVRGDFEQAQEHWRHVFRREMVGRGRWSEKFLTLTVPHSGSAANDVAVLHAAWRIFSRRLREWFCKHDARARRKIAPGVSQLPVPYLRVMEITRSDHGHAHAHAWFLGPFVPHFIVRILWGRALAQVATVGTGDAGFPVRLVDEVIADCEAAATSDFRRDAVAAQVKHVAKHARGKRMRYVPWPVVDIRAADSGSGSELVKYLLKDLGPSGEPMDPLEYANLVEATEGRRTFCASRGLWVRLPARVCGCCELSSRRVRIVGGAARSAAPRGPPLFRPYQEA